MFIPVIMAGGSGSRLWPLSRQAHPKQFLAIGSDDSMLVQTLRRLDGLEHNAPLIVTNEDHRFMVAEQLRLAGFQNTKLLLEPMARNTAPAIALAALAGLSEAQDPILLVLAADHHIHDTTAFHAAVKKARQEAENGNLVTFGITPTHAETGFGYIQYGEPSTAGYKVTRFIEKPDQSNAERYISEGNYLWNSGMFMFKASRYLEELKHFRPDIYRSCKEAFNQRSTDHDFIRVSKSAFAACPEDSVDYAVMERTEASYVIPLNAGWSDVGSWSAIWEVSPHDESRNTIQGDVINLGSHNCLIHAEHRLVATVGLEDLVVVETKDAVLVARREDTQQVKQVVDQLKQAGRPEYQHHPLVARPWGHYDSVDNGPRHQVKRISVLPGERLSVQMHYHRAEHWIVVSGTAKVTCGDKTILLTENQSTYIPVGVVHCLENPGKVPLELIEVQSGSYLGEDDIVRFDDRYGRLEKV
ncbi:mannose-1-phosphate guanylyltransferase/mannose-6-phosphate isomerase [Pseudomonas sp. MAG002Y]|uniref:mannose-1-phosphate guanylyltransferase/mannose-6-phosphate isomerase n=1 Tax=Pseudomonas sp. MAG002Y TaxID=2678690 RepID=UPI001C60D8FD|nr:mannose-1-phosphate guanylyltransferase/mannose-6-phosphate isomerase [Pseudomonas sp. MAG002Y]MBW5413085.1 mannose-1-phosphate guanylyltransferase/mannose-6-phosphate isomerase [Pseudomonas sp. MAG002Y]